MLSIASQELPPPLIAAILFYFITSLFVPQTPEFLYPNSAFTWDVAIGNLLSLQGICCRSLVSPFWSLSYEVWFYILFGAFTILLMSKNNKIKILGLIITVAAATVFVLGLSMHYLLVWLMGAIAYFKRPDKKNVSVFWLSFIGFVACALFYQLSQDSHSLSFVIKGANNQLTDILLSLMMCLLIQQVILMEPQSFISIKAEKVLGNMAKFSYSLYLSHRIVFLWIAAYLWPYKSCSFTFKGILIYSSIILISTISCWILYLVSERYSPLIRKKIKTVIGLKY